MIRTRLQPRLWQTGSVGVSTTESTHLPEPVAGFAQMPLKHWKFSLQLAAVPPLATQVCAPVAPTHKKSSRQGSSSLQAAPSPFFAMQLAPSQ